MHRHECVFYGVIILNKRAALKLMRKLLKTQGFRPVSIATDNLSSYGAALGRTSGVCHSR